MHTSAAPGAGISRAIQICLWITVLIAIGIKVMGKRPTDQALIAGGIVWLLGAIPTVVPALLRGG